MPKIVIVVSGSIAAVRIFSQVQLLRAANFSVHVLLTSQARQWISAAALEIATGNPIALTADYLVTPSTIQSILADAKAILIFPASAELLRQLVYETAALITYLKQCAIPMVLAPAMNVMMWQHPAVQRNVKLSIKQKIKILGPVLGTMICGDKGYGRLLEANTVVAALQALLTDTDIPAFSEYKKALNKTPKIPQRFGIKTKRVLLVITGGTDVLASYSLISALQKAGWEVICAMHEAVCHLLPPAGLASLSHHPVYYQHYQTDVRGLEHIRLSEQVDMLLIAPATAVTVTAMLQGAAEDFISCIYLASKKPVVVIPSIDPLHKPLAKNLALLAQDGVNIIPTDFKQDADYSMRVDCIVQTLQNFYAHI